eukprot:scaffold108774_cov27-Tisochrysis_lutea.AAC.1
MITSGEKAAAVVRVAQPVSRPRHVDVEAFRGPRAHFIQRARPWVPFRGFVPVIGVEVRSNTAPESLTLTVCEELSAGMGRPTCGARCTGRGDLRREWFACRSRDVCPNR